MHRRVERLTVSAVLLLDVCLYVSRIIGDSIDLQYFNPNAEYLEPSDFGHGCNKRCNKSFLKTFINAFVTKLLTNVCKR